MNGPSELKPREAVRRYLDRRGTELSESSIKTYRYRLKLWVEWCEDQNIERVSDLNGWTFEQFEAFRAGQGIASPTLHGEMETLLGFIEYLERIEAVEDGLSKKVHVPSVPMSERSRDTMLVPDDALRLLRYYRSHSSVRGTRFHAVLELAWHTGARLGALRGLDLRDYYPDEQYVEFVHRPESETPLKNQMNGERTVSLLPEVVESLNTYIEKFRPDGHDDFGRSPLFVTHHGTRISKNGFRGWMYQATQPCVAGPCPHEYEKDSCEFAGSYTQGSKCPSSRSPHHIRTGSITWHRDRGFPAEVTAERVNASQEVIEQHYDKASQRERMELRRRPHLDKLRIE
ncbi:MULTISPECIES: tyrosine-type recombinase/integrase [Haloferax]|uniref:XerC/D-like integrase n=4 Tax=Haloferax TaxID=2251 RepID=D4GZK3_HALVD|nr:MULTISPECIES: tyrosine-type recombinase/integrase [Haloferax]ADE04781.1 XerC/D-like integrase [Haloferax volcanii DS2]ELY23365.1 XerC/D-like integrase [Haloferax volcanii DS2]MBS8118571.1 tyrosine-type recombinase/integrase [Haloferax volcanii]MBS8123585.1 tyrosine-type recombinase/integrase [Haloferax volcanii]MBS8127454.1 tyrosine-type recombinase/integrase [Haloferax volcanii]